MKKLTSIIAIALLATTTVFNANAEDKKTATTNTSSSSVFEYKSSQLNVGMYESGKVNSMKLNLALTKDAGKKATIKLMDSKGTVLNEERIGKKLTGYNFRFDFSTVEAGKYFIEITEGDSIITKEIIKSTNTLSY
ncbi:T9SS type A sorting domain-containing protein [Emticicia sp. SJ17W-69]|uniref:T9SS type A sorting domain-containing protein n=1 Tax=Emticicia sp. SJ17W-69 TaxID=3421657 RepID=UPI003EBE7DC8